MSRPLRPAVFVDKDGTLVENVPYNVDPALLKFSPGACDALATLAGAGFAIVVATNQSGLARGYFTAEALALLSDALAQHLRAEAGVELVDFVFCPHAPEAGCACRKPAPGMLLDAARRHGLDLGRSWMIGDTLDDVEAGRGAGCRAILYESGGETVWRDGPMRRPHARVATWQEAVLTILWHTRADPRRVPSRVGHAPASGAAVP